jgi:Protein prenyltransferase alpha subunit repeat
MMTSVALKAHPKVYWIWNHRRWCLENVPDGPDEEPQGWKKASWDKELFVVEKMLDADARNCEFSLSSMDRRVLRIRKSTHGIIADMYLRTCPCAERKFRKWRIRPRR